MKTFIHGWEYEPPALQDFLGLVLMLVFVATIVFKSGPMQLVLTGAWLLCIILLIATSRISVPVSPLRWVLVTVVLAATVAVYVVDTPVTHIAQRTITTLWMIWFTANRPHIRKYWREGA